MSLSETLLPEVDEEMASTRKLLERVPEDQPEWRPHAKSMKLARLAQHVVETPSWGRNAIRTEFVDVGEFDRSQVRHMTTRATLLEEFDANVRELRAALEQATDEVLMQPWSLKFKGRTISTQSRLAVIRRFAISHMIHHRAQLGVYLRLLDVPVPGLYGPSADDGRPS